MNIPSWINMVILLLIRIWQHLKISGQFKHKIFLPSFHVSLIDLNSMDIHTLLTINGGLMRCTLRTIMLAIGLTVMRLAMMTLMTITSVTLVFKKINL